jgi:hypothetical protein
MWKKKAECLKFLQIKSNNKTRALIFPDGIHVDKKIPDGTQVLKDERMQLRY